MSVPAPEGTPGQEPATNGNSSTSESGQVPSGEQQPAGQGSQTPVQQFDRAYVEELRRENANRRTRERELEATIAQFQQSEEERRLAGLSELEQAQELARQRENELQTALEAATESEIRLAVVLEASKADVVDPEAALRLIDIDKIEFDQDGTVRNAGEVLAAALDQYPFLKKATVVGGAPAPVVQTPASGPTNPASVRTGPLTREDIAKMSPREINDRWDDVQRVISST